MNTKPQRIKTWARKEPCRTDDIAIHFEQWTHENGLLTKSTALQISFVKKTEEEMFSQQQDAAIRLQREEAQLLMDELWECGISPYRRSRERRANRGNAKAP